MKKPLILDFKVLKELNISIEELLYLNSLYNKEEYKQSEINFEKLEKNKLIKIIRKNEKVEIILRNKSINIVEFLTIEVNNSFKEEKISIKKSERAINNEIKDRIEEYRTKWKGLKSGAMGSPKACEVKLTRWMKENPTYSFEDILKAVDIYIDNLNGDYRFLQRADYFIFKQENNKEEASRLSAYIDEIDISIQKDWTSNLN